MAFNPFEKNHNEQLTPEDLQLLVTNSVREGYIIEYKREFPTNAKVANSIASFGNTYGGWYIVGIEEESGVARRVVGLDLSEPEDGVSKIREVAKSRIGPVPELYPQAVRLPSGRSVLATYVPSGQDTPFITSDGRIYRRVVDSSDPIPETDRHALDRLIDQGKESRQHFERFCIDHREFSADELNGWVGIFLSPYRPESRLDVQELLVGDGIAKLLARSQSPQGLRVGQNSVELGGIPFTAAQLTHQSVLLKQVSFDRSASNSLQIELYFDGKVKIFVPIHEYEWLPDPREVTTPSVKKILNRLDSSDPEHDLRQLRFFDAGELALVIAILVTFYERLLDNGTLPAKMLFAAELTSVWRLVPFVDDEVWATRVEKFGLPVMMRDDVQIGTGTNSPGFMFDTLGDAPLWSLVASWVLQAFGMPPNFMGTLLGSGVVKHAGRQDVDES